MRTTLSRTAYDVVLLLARIVLGGVLLLHGWLKVRDGVPVDAVAATRLPLPQALAWGGTLLELVGGVLLVIGLATPLVAGAVVIEQIVILIWLHRPSSLLSVQTWEASAVIGMLALLILTCGAGRLALDRMFRRQAGED